MTQYLLKLSFDQRQVTQSLNYEFLLKENSSDYPIVDEGPLAGTFNFKQGDEIIIEVVATSAAAGGNDVLEAFNVVNCTFISIPTGTTDPLSMFDKSSACWTVNNWGPMVNYPVKGQNMRGLMRQSVEKQAIVSIENGQWQISGFLSVELTTAAGEQQARLFFFDPEGSTGNGGGRD